jgi:hypothetical protein
MGSRASTFNKVLPAPARRWQGAHLIQRRDTIFHVPKRKRDSAMGVPWAGTCTDQWTNRAERRRKCSNETPEKKRSGDRMELMSQLLTKSWYLSVPFWTNNGIFAMNGRKRPAFSKHRDFFLRLPWWGRDAILVEVKIIYVIPSCCCWVSVMMPNGPSSSFDYSKRW